MKGKKDNTYILFLFVVTENQDDFVKMIGEEISLVATSPDIRYYYGPQSAVYVFSSDENFKDLSEYLTIMFSDDEMTYMFLPLDVNNMTSGFGEKVDNHLFGDKPLSSKPKNSSKSYNEFKDDFDEFVQMCKEEDDDIMFKIKPKPYVPTVNEILEKIKNNGINSISIEEKTILDEYSQQL